jgi:hypothetical protein
MCPSCASRNPGCPVLLPCPSGVSWNPGCLSPGRPEDGSSKAGQGDVASRYPSRLGCICWYPRPPRRIRRYRAGTAVVPAASVGLPLCRLHPLAPLRSCSRLGGIRICPQGLRMLWLGVPFSGQWHPWDQPHPRCQAPSVPVGLPVLIPEDETNVPSAAAGCFSGPVGPVWRRGPGPADKFPSRPIQRQGSCLHLYQRTSSEAPGWPPESPVAPPNLPAGTRL